MRVETVSTFCNKVSVNGSIVVYAVVHIYCYLTTLSEKAHWDIQVIKLFLYVHGLSRAVIW